MFGDIQLNGVIAFILDASGSMRGRKEAKVKEETIRLLQLLPDGATFAMFSYGDVQREWNGGNVGKIPQDRTSIIQWVQSRYICDGSTENALPRCMASAMQVPGLGQISLLCDGGSTDHYLAPWIHNTSHMHPSVPVNTTFLSDNHYGSSDSCIQGLKNISNKTGGTYKEFDCGGHDGGHRHHAGIPPIFFGGHRHHAGIPPGFFFGGR